MDRTQRERKKFVKQMQNIASDINKEILNENFHFEIFFSGRDEDFFNMIFSNGKGSIKVQIELENHIYKITGNEKIDCFIKNIESIDMNFEKKAQEENENLNSSILSFIKDNLF